MLHNASNGEVHCAPGIPGSGAISICNVLGWSGREALWAPLPAWQLPEVSVCGPRMWCLHQATSSGSTSSDSSIPSCGLRHVTWPLGAVSKTCFGDFVGNATEMLCILSDLPTPRQPREGLRIPRGPGAAPYPSPLAGIVCWSLAQPRRTLCHQGLEDIVI